MEGASEPLCLYICVSFCWEFRVLDHVTNILIIDSVCIPGVLNDVVCFLCFGIYKASESEQEGGEGGLEGEGLKHHIRGCPYFRAQEDQFEGGG